MDRPDGSPPGWSGTGQCLAAAAEKDHGRGAARAEGYRYRVHAAGPERRGEPPLLAVAGPGDEQARRRRGLRLEQGHVAAAGPAQPQDPHARPGQRGG
jgi:hypothetical protein